MPEKYVDWSKTTRSKDYRGSSSFATFLIIGPVCFFLGMIFAQFPYDYPLLWTKQPLDPAFWDQLEIHLKHIHNAPPLIARMLTIMIGVGFLGLFIKLYKASESNMLFDGASLVMYVIGVGLYAANIVKALRMVTINFWESKAYLERPAEDPHQPGPVILGKHDSLKVLAASDTILALVLVGILVLQAGQWYAERKDLQEFEKAQLQEREKAESAAAATEAPSSTATSTGKSSGSPSAATPRGNKKKQ